MAIIRIDIFRILDGYHKNLYTGCFFYWFPKWIGHKIFSFDPIPKPFLGLSLIELCIRNIQERLNLSFHNEPGGSLFLEPYFLYLEPILTLFSQNYVKWSMFFDIPMKETGSTPLQGWYTTMCIHWNWMKSFQIKNKTEKSFKIAVFYWFY